MGDPATMDEASILQTKLAEAESRIETLRRAQADAKAKAKAVIQKQRQTAGEKIEALAAENRHQAQELEAIKALLRDSDSQTVRLSEEREALQTLVEKGKEDISKVLSRHEQVEKSLQTAVEEKYALEEAARTERATFASRISSLEDELQAERNKIANGNLFYPSEDDHPNADHLTEHPSSVDIEGSILKEQLEQARQEIIQLRSTCDELQRKDKLVAEEVSPAVMIEGETTGGPDQPVGEILLEMRQFKKQAEELTQELSKAREEIDLKEQEYKKTVEVLKLEKETLDHDLLTNEKKVKKLQSDLEKSELALQAEREKLLIAQKSISDGSSSGDEGKKILEAKIAEMERIVAAKQADIVKVRDKAKSYLKDINAEKREMEERLKREKEELRKEIEAEQNIVRIAEQRADNASAELDNCLALIREKQKSLQMLKMSMNSEREMVVEARRETDMLRLEFSAYKERARIALQEKQAFVDTSDTAVEAATSGMRAEIEKVRKEAQYLRKQLSIGKETESRVQELTERAEKAEVAVELLKNAASGVSSANYSQIDVLEEKIAGLQNEIMIARTAVEDAEARHETTRMRLEAAERALRAAELRAQEAERLSGNIIEGLRKQVVVLQKNLERAEESSAAAQRTAAVAAKALAFTAPDADEEANNTVKGSPKQLTGASSNKRGSLGDQSSPYSSATNLHGGRSSLAAAMDGHSDSLGLGPRNFALLNGGSDLSEADLIARDHQITVLTTQIAELGALLDEAQQESNLKSEQTDLLKSEVKNLDAKLAAAEKLQNGAPFSYLRTIVVRYLETDDPTLLPVIANVLSFTEEQASRVKAHRGSSAPTSAISGTPQNAGYFSIPFLGSR